MYRDLSILRPPYFQMTNASKIRPETMFCQKVKPRNLEELSGVLALARPGALAFVDQYANYTNNDPFISSN